MKSNKVSGDFSNWNSDGQGLILGDEWSGGSRDWQGQFYAIAFYDRALTAPEIEQRNQRLSE